MNITQFEAVNNVSLVLKDQTCNVAAWVSWCETQVFNDAFVDIRIIGLVAFTLIVYSALSSLKEYQIYNPPPDLRYRIQRHHLNICVTVSLVILLLYMIVLTWRLIYGY